MIRRRLGDAAAFFAGCCLGFLAPPWLQQAASLLVVLAVLAVLAHLCLGALRLLRCARTAWAARSAATLIRRPRPDQPTDSERRLLAWLAGRRTHSHTRSPARVRRRHPDGLRRTPQHTPHGPD